MIKGKIWSKDVMLTCPLGAPLRRAGSEEGPSSGESYDFIVGTLMIKLHTHVYSQWN